MEVKLETITNSINSSFSMMVNPRLSDLFFWHFHPEYELVYIRNAHGKRHVGEHITDYAGSDLVLIGSNIPHLNFDYGVQTDYEKVVLHLNKEFVESHFSSAPELQPVEKLFQASARGIAFTGPDKHDIGERLFELAQKEDFTQFLCLMEILRDLAQLNTVEYLHERPYRNTISSREQERLHLVHAFIDNNYHRKIDLEEIASECALTREAFCRYFKKMTTYTFVEFLNRYRVSHAKRHLMAGNSISDACYASGFQSLSYFNRVFKKISGENPSEFRKR
ncbi:AraC-type DNA-binding protein [Robiginitalea myxolifaciens]|uniref:AraC-type DNA-binding protein n=1 Tax=Robiginitalea myxolifaciens TaxID=400055 RepID=A0A1I6HD05_9FLAO|nr:AraC family transcriptional regulator [Robiginitalea myxolifaciens]SFR52254.1 AraC-type DNA-binding protein [Robiginitalea myxolifaciens]